MKKSTKKKVKTTVFWTALGSAALGVAQNVAVLFGYEISAETSNHLILVGASLISLLTVAGVLVDTKDVDSYQAIRSKKKK